MHLLYNPLGTGQIHKGREMLIEQYPNCQLGFLDDQDGQSGSGSVLTQTSTQGNRPAWLLTVIKKYSFLEDTVASGNEISNVREFHLVV
jgi:hypothetical protein